jgi:CTP synthase (UTP-ammonia lyase)
MERYNHGVRFLTHCRELGSDAYFRQERLFDTVTIALVGKYTDLKDSYMSVTKALEHSAFRVHRKLIIHVRHSVLRILSEKSLTASVVGRILRSGGRDARISSGSVP